MRVVLLLLPLACYAYDLDGSVRKHEGFSQEPYRDADGWSVGYGFWSKDKPESITRAEAETRLIEELKICWDDVADLVGEDHPKEVLGVLAEMRYQLGFAGIKKFIKTLEYVRNKNYYLASFEMLDSKWYREDSPTRAFELAQIMRAQ